MSSVDCKSSLDRLAESLDRVDDLPPTSIETLTAFLDAFEPLLEKLKVLVCDLEITLKTMEDLVYTPSDYHRF